jgi:hypothetical protein
MSAPARIDERRRRRELARRLAQSVVLHANDCRKVLRC